MLWRARQGGLCRAALVMAWAVMAAIGGAVVAPGAVAQQASPFDEGPFEVQATQPVATILTVDIERLFSGSMFGARIASEYATGRANLAVENRRIAEALREEELALAEQRPDMDIDVFRAEATAFDEKAQAIRRAQDAKERDFDEVFARGREQFLEVSQPILGQLMVERGAYAVLDRRSILLSLGSIDVTDDAIARVDAAIGDGLRVDLLDAGGDGGGESGDGANEEASDGAATE